MPTILTVRFRPRTPIFSATHWPWSSLKPRTVFVQTQVQVNTKPFHARKWRIRDKSVDYTVPEIRYDGPKKPPMPPLKALYQIPPLSFLCSQVISVHRSHDLDYQFMKYIVTRESCPEWSGYNTELARQTGMAIEPKAKVVYLPLMDKAPASTSTILTAIEKGLTLLNDAGTGQNILVFR